VEGAAKEMDHFKKPTTLDEALEAKLNPVLEAINEHVGKIYQDFNGSLFKQGQRMDSLESAIQQTEISISKMVQVLWGIVNKSNARMSALERVLINNGLEQSQLEDEILKVEEELDATGEWSKVQLEEINKKIIQKPETTSAQIPQPKGQAPQL